MVEEKPIEQKPAEVFVLDESVSKFSHLPLSDKLKEILTKEGFENLTKIQREAIPQILQNRNVVLKSETGSGKTLAYLVPLIEYLSHYSLNVQKIHREESGTMAIIFSPTRELAVQIDIELKRLLKLFYYMVSTTIMGGESASREKSRLRKGCVILICTPGRLLYHLQNTQSLKMDNLQCMIFDEADRMLDMGFEKEMNQCLELIREKAAPRFQPANDKGNFWSDSLKINFVSATMNPKVESLGHRLMQEYVKVGFEPGAGEEKKEEDIVGSIPKQV